MRSHLTILVTVIASMLAACAAEPTESSKHKPVITEADQVRGLKLNVLPNKPAPSDSGPVSATPPLTVSVVEVTMCAQLPTDSDDPCAHACEPNGLDEFIEAGTCAAFSCSLPDGTEFRVGTCKAL